MKLFSKKDRSQSRPVQTVEVSEKFIGLRITLLVLLIVAAIASFGYGINAWISVEPGWQTISVTSTSQNCGEYFTLLYNLGAGETGATSERRALIQLYNELCVTAYEVFNSDEEMEDCYNVCYINQHPNEIIEVDDALYEAFSLLNESGTRYLYLADAYSVYFSLFYAETDEEAAEYDPALNAEMGDFYLTLADYICDENHISVELLGNNQICLRVSDEYLAFAEENGLEKLIDFGWMKNAFIIDYLADSLIENGYTRGNISSVEGFARGLETETETEFYFTMYHRDGLEIAEAADIIYAGNMSCVYLHDYPLTDDDLQNRYYVYLDGEIRSLMIDPQDGLSKAAVAEIVACSAETGCADLALKAAGAFIADTFDADVLEALMAEGIVSCYYADGEVQYVGEWE
ncbi:MAG: hypothetical protein LUI10_00505 [Lachnospiraceae bacterium]|nr:hypothetical protein [Lachnospiraceae bacterium]